MEIPNEIEWNIVKYMSHPVADLFKNELEEELEAENKKLFQSRITLDFATPKCLT